MKMTLFNTPILSAFLRLAANLALRMSGWRVEGRLPDLPKFLIIGAPHTSNWDFVLFLGVVFHLKANVKFMGKAELFRSPFGWFFHYCGGVPVERSKPGGLVEQMVELCRKSEQFILVITPEGTRRYVREWKMGFYHIAVGAGIPIVAGRVDGRRKTVWIDAPFYPSGDMEADLRLIREKFKDITGIKPHKKYITLPD
jgi:1-acyl-sn-glycerol-3-phosphate acyltransferase